MTYIVSTITTDDPVVYQQRMQEFVQFAPAIHIDITDGQFAPSETVNLNQIYWRQFEPFDAKIVLHLMMHDPVAWVDQIVSLYPDLVIAHAEASAAAKLPSLAQHLAKFGIEFGIALLPETQPESAAELIKLAQHVLIFGGHLGYQGGTADLTQLKKVAAVRQINPQIQLEWDGGANQDNGVELQQAGISWINVGGAISHAPNARVAYQKLTALVDETC